mgnify:FL=1|jgi:hypothetical protein
MITRNFIVALFSIFSLNSFAQDTIFEKIYNKTWFEDNGFAGATIVFYKTSNGLLKAIRQINGSGVPVIASEIYDFENRNDTVFLFNGLNLKTAEKVDDYSYNFDNKTGYIYKNGIQLKILSVEPILFKWTEKRKDFTTQIDVKMLRKIFISKNEIYKESDLIQILKDK